VSNRKFGVAGGINASNSKQASKLNAFLLDIASGAEDTDCRRKSPIKLAKIFSALRGD
jgi:phosphoribosylanthranilate isomerase